MLLPPGYVDPPPARGPWIDAATLPEPFQWDIAAMHPDGKTEPVTWTGEVWWTYRGEIKPVAWRSFAQRQMTA